MLAKICPANEVGGGGGGGRGFGASSRGIAGVGGWFTNGTLNSSGVIPTITLVHFAWLLGLYLFFAN